MSEINLPAEQVYVVNWNDKIIGVPVVKRTKCFVWVTRKDWSDHQIEERYAVEKVFSSWDACHKAMIERARIKLTRAQRELDRCRSYLQTIEGMKP